LLKHHRYNDEACLAEERAFLKDYTVPFVQLDPMKVILVFSHEHNTFDKRKLLTNANPDLVRDSPKKVMDFIKDAAQRRFYMVELEKLLEDYAPGRPEMKPDVIAQTLQLEKERAKMAEDAAAAGGAGGQIILQQPGQEPVALNNQQVIQIIQKLQTDLDERTKEVAMLKSQNSTLKENYESLLMERLRAPIASIPRPAPAPAPSPAPTAEPVDTAPTTTSADTETIFV
jgi:hypothetical protein